MYNVSIDYYTLLDKPTNLHKYALIVLNYNNKSLLINLTRKLR